MTEKRARRANAGVKVIGRPHSVKTEEITEQFVKWGIIGKRRERVTLVRLPFFDKGPGIVVKTNE